MEGKPRAFQIDEPFGPEILVGFPDWPKHKHPSEKEIGPPTAHIAGRPRGVDGKPGQEIDRSEPIQNDQKGFGVAPGHRCS